MKALTLAEAVRVARLADAHYQALERQWLDTKASGEAMPDDLRQQLEDARVDAGLANRAVSLAREQLDEGNAYWVK